MCSMVIEDLTYVVYGRMIYVCQGCPREPSYCFIFFHTIWLFSSAESLAIQS